MATSGTESARASEGRDQVRDARPRRGQTHRRLARRARHALGDETSALLVSRQHVPHPARLQRIVQGQDGSPRNADDDVDAAPLELAHDERGSGEGQHRSDAGRFCRGARMLEQGELPLGLGLRGSCAQGTPGAGAGGVGADERGRCHDLARLSRTTREAQSDTTKPHRATPTGLLFSLNVPYAAQTGNVSTTRTTSRRPLTATAPGARRALTIVAAEGDMGR